ncbi:hypothetical protein ACSBR1_016354 [Camellia fascicularis]
MHPSQNQIQIQGTRNDRQYGQPDKTHDDRQYGQPHMTKDDGQYGQPHRTHDDRQYGQPHMTKDNRQYGQPHMTHDDRQYGQHKTTRYYVHRVRESLTTRISKIVCAIFLTILFILGIIFFILWLSLRPHRTRFHIRDFSVPGLNQSNGFENAEVIFNVTARNSNQVIGIHYDAMQVTLYYQDQAIGKTFLLFPFYQKPKNTTVLYGVLSGATLTVNSNRWMQFQNDRDQGVVVFRLQVTSTIRFKVSKWDSKHHKMHANCEAGVGPDGSILANYKDKRCPVYFT